MLVGVLNVNTEALAGQDEGEWWHTLYSLVDGVLLGCPNVVKLPSDVTSLTAIVEPRLSCPAQEAQLLVDFALQLLRVFSKWTLPNGEALPVQFGLHTGEFGDALHGGRYVYLGPAVSGARALAESAAQSTLQISAQVVQYLPDPASWQYIKPVRVVAGQMPLQAMVPVWQAEAFAGGASSSAAKAFDDDETHMQAPMAQDFSVCRQRGQLTFTDPGMEARFRQRFSEQHYYSDLFVTLALAFYITLVRYMKYGDVVEAQYGTVWAYGFPAFHMAREILFLFVQVAQCMLQLVWPSFYVAHREVLMAIGRIHRMVFASTYYCHAQDPSLEACGTLCKLNLIAFSHRRTSIGALAVITVSASNLLQPYGCLGDAVATMLSAMKAHQMCSAGYFPALGMAACWPLVAFAQFLLGVLLPSLLLIFVERRRRDQYTAEEYAAQSQKKAAASESAAPTHDHAAKAKLCQE